MTRDAIYTNVALLPDGDVWWEGKTDEPPRRHRLDRPAVERRDCDRGKRPPIPTAASPRR